MEFSVFIPDSAVLEYCGIGDKHRKFALLDHIAQKLDWNIIEMYSGTEFCGTNN